MQNERGRRVLPALALLTAALALGGLLKASETTSTQWTGGVGQWTEVSRWSDGLPDAYRETVVGGRSNLAIPTGNYFLSDLEVGCNRGDHVRVEVDGGRMVLLQDSLRIGEYTGSEAEFVLKDGALHSAMDVFVGAATARSRAAASPKPLLAPVMTTIFPEIPVPFMAVKYHKPENGSPSNLREPLKYCSNLPPWCRWLRGYSSTRDTAGPG